MPDVELAHRLLAEDEPATVRALGEARDEISERVVLHRGRVVGAVGDNLLAQPDFFGAHMNLAAIHASLGEMHLARASLAEVMRLRPDFSISMVPRLSTGRGSLLEGLRKAGLRE